jgi:hypothetical protein
MARRKQPPAKTFDTATAYFRAHSFDVEEMPGDSPRIQIRKYGCAAVVSRGPDGKAVFAEGPGYLIGGEISVLIDRGFQKFLTTPRMRLPATADRLRALHRFKDEAMEATGKVDYYNLSLGTTSDRYYYDRVKNRDDRPETAPGTQTA